MHGGKMYIRGKLNEALAGREIKLSPLDDEDNAFLRQTIDEYAAHFGTDVSGVKLSDFKKFQPKSSRPYGNMYIAN
jgi:glutamate synthase domain-containing protein 3